METDRFEPVDVEIADNPEANRYELRHDGVVVGVVEYRLAGDVFVIPHVEVIPALRGKGHSEPFLEVVLDAVEDRNLKVRPICGYANAHINSRPERVALLAP